MKYFFSISVILLALGYGAFAVYENYFYLKAIPAQIEIQGILKKKSKGFIRESCGGVIFQLSKSAITEVRKGGIKFLNKNLHGRGYQDENNRSRAYYTYKPWKETPVQLGLDSSPGLGCLLDGDEDMAKKILSSAESNGSFHTDKSETHLLLIPDLGLLVYAYFG